MLHCKLREFCKEASILNRCGTKNKCSVLFPNVNDKRLKNYCKIDALHTPFICFCNIFVLIFGKKNNKVRKKNVHFKMTSVSPRPVAYHV